MLNQLKIQNYALIQALDIEPSAGLNIVTGETGAGKSIMLGAIGLLLGNRADTKVLFDKDQKCFVEGEFDLGEYNLQQFFDSAELDYENPTIIRREISKSGKSRAFVNDTPVNLNTLKELGYFLMDVHSQNDTQLLGNNDYQLNMVDSFGNLTDQVSDYKILYSDYKEKERKYLELQEEERKIREEYDYNKFLYEELASADLQEGETEILETDLKVLENAEEIKHALHFAHQSLRNADDNLADRLREVSNQLAKIEDISADYKLIKERIDSSLLELSDASSEIEHLEDSVEFDPKRQEELSERLSLIYNLLQKHSVPGIDTLIKKRDELESKLERFENLEEDLSDYKNKVDLAHEKAAIEASKISKARIQLFSSFCTEIEEILKELAIPNAHVKIAHQSTTLNANGIDDIEIQFSANKGIEPASLVSVASGGEFSRLMFSIKYILAEKTALPTIIFDEIDTGVSGEVALKLGVMMQKMSQNHQVISISHLPQIAAKAQRHYFVFKDESEAISISKIRELSQEDRITEIAKMIGGDTPSESAVNSAKELIAGAAHS